MKILTTLMAFAILIWFALLAISADKKDHGIGPIKDVKLGPINKSMVDKGRKIFNTKCIACHTLDEKKIGPPLRNVAKEQTPEYIMNLMLNTQEMQQKDERVKRLLVQYKVPMINNQLSKDEARWTYEYLRYASENKGAR